MDGEKKGHFHEPCPAAIVYLAEIINSTKFRISKFNVNVLVQSQKRYQSSKSNSVQA